MTPIVISILYLLAPGIDSESGEKTTYYFGSNPARTDISFSSKTEITNILGTTKALHGSASIDFREGGGSCHLIVPVKTLNTGMDDRDRAMFNETWINVEEYPTIEFKGSKAVKKSDRNWEIAGTFTLQCKRRVDNPPRPCCAA